MLKARTVSFVMTAENLLTVNADDDLERVQALLRDHSIHHVPVLENGKLVGIISTTDLLRHGLQVREFERPSVVPGLVDPPLVREIMETSLVTLRPRDPLLKAAQLLIKESFGSLPVVDEFGELVGIITIRDLLRHMIEESAAE